MSVAAAGHSNVAPSDSKRKSHFWRKDRGSSYG